MRRIGALAGCALALVTGAARAAGPLGPNGSPITTSNYQIDLFQGPVLTSNRVIGMGGAFAGVAEGLDGFYSNPASGAVRVPWSTTWFDYELSAGLTFPGSLTSTDFDNDGKVGFAYRNFFFATLGANLQFGKWAIGVVTDVQHYSLGGTTQQGPSQELGVDVSKVRLQLSRSFLDGALVLGVGLRQGIFSLDATPVGSNKSQDLFSITSGGAELGAVIAPNELPIRVGLAYRSKLSADSSSRTGSATADAAGDTVAGGRVLPSAAVLPWEVEAGVAWQIGPRPLNVPFVDTHAPPPDYAPEYVDATDPRDRKWDREKITQHLKDRERSLPRERLLLSASVVVSGPVANGVSLESFLRQTVARSGRDVVVSPHLGAEAEVLPTRLQVRAGSYLEPSRFRGIDPRVHGTFGADVRLFEWTVFGLFDDGTRWRAGGSLDATARYFGWGLTVGVWH